MRRLLRHVLLSTANALDTSSVGADETRRKETTAPTTTVHPLELVLNELHRSARLTAEGTAQPDTLSSKLLTSAIATADSTPGAAPSRSEATDPLTSEVSLGLFRSLVSGVVGRALPRSALSGPLFPRANELTFHTSAFACAGANTVERQTRTTALAAQAERGTANYIAQRLHLPRRFHWPACAEDLAAQTPTMITTDAQALLGSPASNMASVRPALGLRQHTWTPVVTDARGERHAMEDVGSAPSTQVLLGHGTNTEARALFAFQPAASTASRGRTAASERRNSTANDGGGGVVYATTLEAYLCLLHTARTQALTRCRPPHGTTAATVGADKEVQNAARLVVYASDQADPQLLSVARLLGFQHVHTFQTVVTPQTGNYAVSVGAVKRQIVEDLGRGLFPCLVVGVLGARGSGAVDPLVALSTFCQKTGVWFHIDASASGQALLAATTEGDTGAYQHRVLAAEAEAVFTAMQHASTVADSMVVCLDEGALPSSPTRPSQTALFLAHTAKLAWSLRHTLSGSARISGDGTGGGGVPINGWYFPNPATHRHALDALHLTPPRARRQSGLGEALTLATQLVAHPLPSAATVRCQQDTLAALRDALAADGRFDTPLKGTTLFGLVLFRWLTCTDEAVVELAEAWRDVLAEWAVGESPRACVVLPLGVGLVAIQKRLWLTVSLTSPVASAEEGRALAARARASLQEAAARCGQ